MQSAASSVHRKPKPQLEEEVSSSRRAPWPHGHAHRRCMRDADARSGLGACSALGRSAKSGAVVAEDSPMGEIYLVLLHSAIALAVTTTTAVAPADTTVRLLLSAAVVRMRQVIASLAVRPLQTAPAAAVVVARSVVHIMYQNRFEGSESCRTERPAVMGRTGEWRKEGEDGVSDAEKDGDAQ